MNVKIEICIHGVSEEKCRTETADALAEPILDVVYATHNDATCQVYWENDPVHEHDWEIVVKAGQMEPTALLCAECGERWSVSK